jgi:hypothetical protein
VYCGKSSLVRRSFIRTPTAIFRRRLSAIESADAYATCTRLAICDARGTSSAISTWRT